MKPNDIAEATADEDEPLRVFYIGDWDPSGMCMSEQIGLYQHLRGYE